MAGEWDLNPRSPVVSPLLGPKTGILDHAGPSPHKVRVYLRYAVAIPFSATHFDGPSPPTRANPALTEHNL